jgi:hypothetical protein
VPARNVPLAEVQLYFKFPASVPSTIHSIDEFNHARTRFSPMVISLEGSDIFNTTGASGFRFACESGAGTGADSGAGAVAGGGSGAGVDAGAAQETPLHNTTTMTAAEKIISANLILFIPRELS